MQLYANNFCEGLKNYFLPAAITEENLITKMRKLVEASENGQLDTLTQNDHFTLKEYELARKILKEPKQAQIEIVNKFIKIFVPDYENDQITLHFTIPTRNPLSSPVNRIINKISGFFTRFGPMHLKSADETSNSTYFFFHAYNRKNYFNPFKANEKVYSIDPLALVPNLPEQYQEEFKQRFKVILTENLNAGDTVFECNSIVQKMMNRQNPSSRFEQFKGCLAGINVYLAPLKIIIAKCTPGKVKKISEMGDKRVLCSEFYAYHLLKAANSTSAELRQKYDDDAIPLPEYMDVLGLPKNISPYAITPGALRQGLKKKNIISVQKPPIYQFIRF